VNGGPQAGLVCLTSLVSKSFTIPSILNPDYKQMCIRRRPSTPPSNLPTSCQVDQQQRGPLTERRCPSSLPVAWAGVSERSFPRSNSNSSSSFGGGGGGSSSSSSRGNDDDDDDDDSHES
jgi:hypothetical protein